MAEIVLQVISILLINTLLTFNTIIGTPERMTSIFILFAVSGVFCALLLIKDRKTIKDTVVNPYTVWMIYFGILLFVYGVQLQDKNRYAATFHAANLAYVILIMCILWHLKDKMLDSLCIVGTIQAVIRFVYSLNYEWDELVRVREYDGWIRLGNTPIENVNAAAIWYSLFLVPLMFNLFFRKKWWCIPGAIVCAVGAFFSGSKKSVLMIAILFLICITIGAKSWKRALINVGILVVAFLIMLPKFHDNYTLWVFIGSRFEDVIAYLKGEATSGSSSMARASYFKIALENSWDKPLFGHGWDAFRIDLSTKIGDFETYSHNNFAEILYDMGIWGIISYYVAPAMLFVDAIRSKQKDTVVYIFMTLLTTIIAEVGSVSVYYTITIILFWGCAYIFERLEHEKS